MVSCECLDKIVQKPLEVSGVGLAIERIEVLRGVRILPTFKIGHHARRDALNRDGLDCFLRFGHTTDVVRSPERRKSPTPRPACLERNQSAIAAFGEFALLGLRSIMLLSSLSQAVQPPKQGNRGSCRRRLV